MAYDYYTFKKKLDELQYGDPRVKVVEDEKGQKVIETPSLRQEYGYKLPTTTATMTGGKTKKGTWFDSGAFDDGYDFGDGIKTLLGIGSDVAQNFTKGALQIGEGALDLATYGVGGALDLFGAKKQAEEVKKFGQKNLVEDWDLVNKTITSINPLLGVIDTGKKVVDAISQKDASKLIDPKSSLSGTLDKFSKDYSLLGDKSDQIVQGVGYVGGMTGLSLVGVNPLATAFVTSMGNEMTNAFNKNASYGEAFMSGLISGGSEAGSEMLFGGLGKTIGKGALDDLVASGVGKIFKKQLNRNLAEFGIKSLGEGAEEIISSAGQEIGRAITYGSEYGNPLEFLGDKERMEEFINGAIVSAIVQSPSLMRSNKVGRDFVSDLTQNEQKVVDTESNRIMSEKQKQLAIDTEVENIIAEQEKTFGTLSEAEKTGIKNQVQSKLDNGEIDYTTSKLKNKEITAIQEQVKSDLQRGYIDVDTIESTLSSEKTAQIKELEKQLEDTKKLDDRQSIEEKLNSLRTSRATELKGIMNNDSYLQKSYLEQARKSEKFTYEAKETDSDIKKSLYENASKILNNTTKSHELVETITKIAEDKGTNYGLVNNEQLKQLGYDVEGKNINGLVRVNEDGTQKVLINVDSEKSLNTILGHETTHLLEDTAEYKELQQMVKEYATTKGDYDTKLKEVTDLYKNTNANIENEVTSDLVGDYLFTDEQFINNLSAQKPNVFQKVYDYVKHVYKMATAGSKEARQLEQVKRKFEQAYRQNVNTSEETKFSVQEREDGSKYVLVDSDQHIFYDVKPKNYRKVAKKYINDYLRGETDLGSIYTDDTVNIGTKGANKYTTPGKRQQNFNEKMKMAPELQNALEVAELIGTNTATKENSKYSSWAYYNFDFSIDGKEFSGRINIGVDKNGNKHFYEINNIQQKSTADISANISPNRSVSANDNISNKDTSVKDSVLSNNKNDTKYSLSEDSKGKKLSNDQIKFFERSQVRDAEGKLKEVYHGTGTTINEFKTEFTGKGNDQYGSGFYFSDNKADADSYTSSINTNTNEKLGGTDNPNVVTSYLNITNPIVADGSNLSNSNVEMTHEQTVEIIKKAPNLYDVDETPIGNWHDVWSEGVQDYMIEDVASEYEGDLLSLENDFFNGESTKFREAVYDATGYDGVIHTFDNGSTHYIAWFPNQIKSSSNVNPTLENADIRKSLSNQNEAIAPIGSYNVYGKDVKLQESPIAPVTENVQQTPVTNENYNGTVDQSVVEQEADESLQTLTDEDILPVRENTTPEMEDEVSPTKSLFETRDYEEVGDRKVNAYQYENPEVRPYFQKEAQNMLGDLQSTIKGKRIYNPELAYIDGIADQNGAFGWVGLQRETTESISELLDGMDGKYKLSYADIEKGLKAIIEDHGAENNASSKRIEFYLDQRLREGYTTSDGIQIDPNQEYIDMLSTKNVNEYSEEAYNEWLKSLQGMEAPVDNASNKIVSEEIAPISNEMTENAPLKTKKQLEKRLDTINTRINSLDQYLENINPKIEEFNRRKTEIENNPIGDSLVERSLQEEALNDLAKKYDKVSQQYDKYSTEKEDLLKEKSKIEDDLDQDLVKKTKKELRQDLLIDQNDFFINALDNAKNRSMILMNNTDTIRNTELVFGRENGSKINEIVFQKAIDNESKSIAWQNKERSEIKDLGIKPRSKESEAVQKYGEKQYAVDMADGSSQYVPYGDVELASEFPNVDTQNKIKHASEVLRNKYDNYIDTANSVLTQLGFDAIPKRQDYMRHFQELNDVFSRWGIPFNANSMQEHVLPTDINGLTEFWSPQKNYFANTQKRTGIKTRLDAITGIDGYISGISNLIFHTEDIQRGRAFEELIRDTYGESKGWDNLESLPDELQQARAEKIQDNHLSNYAAWVHEWTNNVAGKKSKIDRSVESMFGRKIFSFLDGARKQVGSNMIGLNLSSSLTNLIALVQAMAKTNKLSMAKGTADTIKNIFIKDSFIEKDSFLTSRMGTDMLSKNAWQKVQDAGFVFMKGLDWFSSNQIVRSKYYELRANGMSEQQAHSEAGKFAARILGDRTKGANAQLYNSKLIGLVTQFQLEVNNQLYSMFYDTYHESKENARNSAMRTTAGMVFTLGQLFAFTHLFGQTFQSIAGYNPTFDIVEMIKVAFGFGDDDDEEDKPLSERLKKSADMLVDALPYVNILTGGGRIPLASGLPNLVGVATGGTDQYGNEMTLDKELKKLLFLLPPTGGNQFKKTTQGLGMFNEDLPVSGSYTDSGNLRYPVEDTPLNRLQAGLFGQYANENARNYFDNERMPLKEKQIQEYADLDMPIKDYWKYREDLKDQKTMAEKFDYVNSMDVSTDQKNIMINNIVDRKEDVDMSNYDDFESYEEFDFATKNEEKYSFFQENNISYKDYKASDESKEAYNWAFNNPESYTFSKSVSKDPVTYRQYASNLDDIKADKDSDGKSIRNSRKPKVSDYINSLDADYGSKIILYKSEYPSDDSYNNEIVDYLNEREDITFDDMVTILTKLGMKVDSTGNVRW